LVVTGRLTIPTADGDLLHYSAVASEPLESKSQALAAEVAASSCLRRRQHWRVLGWSCGGEAMRWQAGSSWEHASVSTTTPRRSSPSALSFTNRQQISSGATCSAGRAKKDRGKFWEGLGGYGSCFKDWQ